MRLRMQGRGFLEVAGCYPGPARSGSCLTLGAHRLKLGPKIGAGGYGTVYRATLAGPGGGSGTTQVTVKVQARSCLWDLFMTSQALRRLAAPQVRRPHCALPGRGTSVDSTTHRPPSRPKRARGDP